MRELAKYKKTTNGHALILESLHSNIQKKNIALEGPYHKRIWDTRNSGRYAPLFLVWSIWAHLFITKTIVPSFITQTFDPPFVTKNCSSQKSWTDRKNWTGRLEDITIIEFLFGFDEADSKGIKC